MEKIARGNIWIAFFAENNFNEFKNYCLEKFDEIDEFKIDEFKDYYENLISFDENIENLLKFINDNF